MKSEMPNWLKYLIIAVAILLIVYVIFWVIKNREFIYEQLKKVQTEIRKLIYERSYLIKKKMKLDKYAKLIFKLIICVCIILIGLLSHYLILNYRYDPFNAFITSVGIVGTTYSIICLLIYNKVFGLNELQERVCISVTKVVYFVGKFEPARITEIEKQLIIKTEEAEKLKQQIKSKNI